MHLPESPDRLPVPLRAKGSAWVRAWVWSVSCGLISSLSVEVLATLRVWVCLFFPFSMFEEHIYKYIKWQLLLNTTDLLSTLEISS